jgi:hypothetical protein
MVLMSALNNCLVNIVNAEKRGKRQVLIRPCSKVSARCCAARRATCACVVWRAWVCAASRCVSGLRARAPQRSLNARAPQALRLRVADRSAAAAADTPLARR